MTEGDNIAHVKDGMAIFNPVLKHIYRDFDGRVTALGSTTMQRGHKILIGTSHGKVYIHNATEAYTVDDNYEYIVYEDGEKRTISALGGLALATLVYIHIRTYGVVIMKESSEDMINDLEGRLLPYTTILSDHHGFCNVISHGFRIVIPSSDKHLIVWSNDSTESTIDLVNTGAPMVLALFHNEPVVGAEDGSVAIYKYLKPGDHIREQIFNSPIFSLTSIDDRLVVGSVASQIKILNSKLRVLANINYPSSAMGCGALAAGDPYSKELKRFAAGFWDGSIRIYSTSSYGIRYVINPINESKHSTNSLVWIVNLLQDQLFAACEDGNLYLYEIETKRSLRSIKRDQQKNEKTKNKSHDDDL